MIDKVRQWSRVLRDDAGQAVVIAAVMMMTVLVAAGFAVDAGILYLERQRQQVAADAAADAAAVELHAHWSAVDRWARVESTARHYATQNGYTGTSVVEVRRPSSGPERIQNEAHVEVIVVRQVPTYFIRLLGPNFATQLVRARAVGGVTPPEVHYSLMAFEATRPGVTITENAFIELDLAGAMINSGNPGALTMTGASEFRIDDRTPSGATIDISGAVSRGLSAEIRPGGALRVGRRTQSDPFLYLPPPPPPPFVTPPLAITVTTGVLDLAPGVYRHINVSGDGQVRLQTGSYIIAGGGITVSDRGRITQLAGQSPFIYNACSNYPSTNPRGDCAGITLTDDAAIRIERRLEHTFPPGTDPKLASDMNRIAIWQPKENCSPFTMSGTTGRSSSRDGDVEVLGAIYMPCADVVLSRDSDLRIYDGALYAKSISVHGDSQIDIDWRTPGTFVFRVPRLVQ